jgi:hypothetical protein
MSDDAQRDMEQRALRNVRSLVDTIETQDSAGRHSAFRIFMWILIVFAVVFGALYVTHLLRGPRPEPKIVVIPPPAKQAVPPAPKAP